MFDFWKKCFPEASNNEIVSLFNKAMDARKRISAPAAHTLLAGAKLIGIEPISYPLTDGYFFYFIKYDRMYLLEIEDNYQCTIADVKLTRIADITNIVNKKKARGTQ